MKSSNPSTALPNLRPGDIIAFSGYNWQSYFINAVTYGVPLFSVSHVGIMAEHANALMLFESTTNTQHPCAIRRQYVRGTQAHFIEDRMATYDGKIWVYPLVKALRRNERHRLSKYLLGTLGRPYDSLGATRSGAKVWAILQSMLHKESVAALFCSEWVADALRHIERFDTDHVGKWNPNSLVREARRRGIVGKPVRLK